MKGLTILRAGGKDVRVEGRLVRVARLDGEKYTFPDDPGATVEELKDCGERIDLFTFLQPVSDTSPRYVYPMEWDNLAVLPVSTFDHWWEHQIRSLARNRARQAEKKRVVVREVPFDDALLHGICQIYNECPIRHGKRFPHYGMTVDMAHGYAGTFLDRCIYIGAFQGDTMIGFIKLVADESRKQACAVHILSMIQHRDKAPTNALIAQAVRSCADRGISHLIYEHFSYGKKQEDSLNHFKSVNGFQRVDVPRFYVPLSRFGSCAFRLGLHQRLTDHLPESLLVRARELRTNWYNRRLHAAADLR